MVLMQNRSAILKATMRARRGIYTVVSISHFAVTVLLSTGRDLVRLPFRRRIQDVSVVIPTVSRHTQVLRTAKRLARHGIAVIIVDNAPDQVIQSRYSRKNILRLSGENRSYSASINLAMQYVDTQYVGLLNDDVKFLGVSDIYNLICYIRGAPNVAAVSPVAANRKGAFGVAAHIGARVDRHHTGAIFPRQNLVGWPKGIRKRAVMNVGYLSFHTVFMRSSTLRDYPLDEHFSFGMEDLDWSLRARQRGDELHVLTRITVWHTEMTSRRFLVGAQRDRLNKLNRWLFAERAPFPRAMTRRVAFIVSTLDDTAGRGDLFVAQGLAGALRDHGWDTSLLTSEMFRVEESANPFFAVIHMVESIEPPPASPSVLQIAWMRNWEDKWFDCLEHLDIDAVWYAANSGEIIAQIEAEFRHSLKIDIASNVTRQINSPWISRPIDVLASFSNWGSSDMRRLPALPNGVVGLSIGKDVRPAQNWLSTELVEYSELLRLMQQSKIAIDMQAISTKQGLSVNHRVWDSLASGCFVVTDNPIFSSQISHPRVVYSTFEDINGIIGGLLASDNLVQGSDGASEVRVVESGLSWDSRASIANRGLNSPVLRPEVAIVGPWPANRDAVPWGDFLIGLGLKKAFAEKGIGARLCSFQQVDALDDEFRAVVVLNGDRYPHLRAKHKTFNWIYSHPSKIDIGALSDSRGVYVSSLDLRAHLEQFGLTSEVVPLGEWLANSTCPHLSESDKELAQNTFVALGNGVSRSRPLVLEAINSRLPVSLWGPNWNDFLTDQGAILRSGPVYRCCRRIIYASAKAVLCDHHPDMVTFRMPSERVWETIAAGGLAIMDFPPEEDLLSERAIVSSVDDLFHVAERILAGGYPTDQSAAALPFFASKIINDVLHHLQDGA